jgi:hypothetical protein
MNKGLFHGNYGSNFGISTICKRGLTLHYDAGNLLSYPGTGTIVKPIYNDDGTTGTLNNIKFDCANGGVFTFNGSSSYIRRSPANLSYPFTISSWAKTNLSTTSQWICGFFNSSDNRPEFALAFGSDGKMWQIAEDLSSSQQNTVSKELYKRFQWYHITGIYYASNNRVLYVNGEYQNQSTTSVNININRFSIGVFDRPSPAVWLNGTVSVVSVYDKALTNSEIKQNYIAGKSRFKTI